MADIKPIQQLTRKVFDDNNNFVKDKNIFPVTITEAIFDKDSKKNLKEVLTDTVNNITNKTVYISESKYEELKRQELLKDDVEYNIFEDKDEDIQ